MALAEVGIVLVAGFVTLYLSLKRRALGWSVISTILFLLVIYYGSLIHPGIVLMGLLLFFFSILVLFLALKRVRKNNIYARD